MFRTLPRLVDGLGRADPGHGLTLVDAGGRETEISWPDLHRRIVERAAWFAARGVAAGDRAVVCLTNDPEVLTSFLALLYLGAVPMSVAQPTVGQGSTLATSLLAHLLRAGEARWVFAQPELLAAEEAARLVPTDALLACFPVAEQQGPPPPPPPPGRPDADALAIVQFSSGSTSRPKGIRLTHRNLRENVRLVIRAGRRHSQEALATWLPLSHDMGLVGSLLATLQVRPRRMVLLHPMRFLMRPVSWLAALSSTRSRISACPNFALDHCAERIRPKQLEERAIDLGDLEMLLVGAETVRPGTLRRFEETFRPWGLGRNVLYPVYGLAEATLIVTAPDPGEPVATRFIDGIECVSVGRALGDFEIAVETGAGLPAHALQTGEICLRGTCVTPGFLDAAFDAETLRDGWLRTGDLGCLDEEGRLYVTGRIKDLLIVDGRNYYAHDICTALEDLPFIKRGGTYALSERVDGHRRVVVVAVPNATRVTESRRVRAIQQRVLDRCGLAVDDVLFVPRIPRTSSGKVMRHICREMWLQRLRR